MEQAPWLREEHARRAIPPKQGDAADQGPAADHPCAKAADSCAFRKAPAESRCNVCRRFVSRIPGNLLPKRLALVSAANHARAHPRPMLFKEHRARVVQAFAVAVEDRRACFT